MLQGRSLDLTLTRVAAHSDHVLIKLLASFAMSRVDYFTDECNFMLGRGRLARPVWAVQGLIGVIPFTWRQADLGWRPPEFVSAQPRTDEAVILH